MINSFLKNQHRNGWSLGAITLMFTVILLVLSTLLIIFAANFGSMQQKTVANYNRNSQAFEAAEAGLEFGINYFQQNSTTILANPAGGHIQPYSDSNTNNVTLANNSKYTITYTNPIANNYNLIQVSSTGTSDDGSSTSVISQRIQFGSTLINPPNAALVVKNQLSVSGNGNVTNTQSNTSIQAASSVSLGGNGKTTLSSGTSSTAGHILSDIQQNSSSLASMSQNDFFATYFGMPAATVKAAAGHYYNNSSSTNYSGTLNGLTGTSIWIDQTSGSGSINGNTTIGSAANPVLLIVNGDLDISGNVTIYGFVYVIGASSAETDISGNVTITGGMISVDRMGMSGNSQIIRDASVFTNLQNQSSMRYYAKVPGSWKDY